MLNVAAGFNIFQATENSFEALALDVFRFQATHNPLYSTYIRSIGRDPEQVGCLRDIPFLPIGFFKTHRVMTTAFEPAPESGPLLYFESSGTTGAVGSRHWIAEPALYEESFLRGFRRFYGDPSDWCILGLLPNYLEKGHSSLVYMVRELIGRSGQEGGGFYLYDHKGLSKQLRRSEARGRRSLLIGVTYALLDFAQDFPMPLGHTTLMETGGMKGRREELIRSEVHGLLRAAFGPVPVHSEYGMTELLSQAYSREGGVFEPVPWMRVLVREEDDPLSVAESGTGVLNVIDLANLYSCAFIGTEDVGTVRPDRSFTVVGRVDHSDMRGCSLMLTL